MLLRFDEIDEWAPSLSSVLAAVLPTDPRHHIADGKPEFVEDAVALLFEVAPQEALVDATLAWLQSGELAAYHGTRLVEEEVLSIQTRGLLPLQARDRRSRLVRALSKHPRWSEVVHTLDAAIEAYGAGGEGGVRENQVHVTLSRAGLTESFNHYLSHGSEFDQCVARAVLGTDGLRLLESDGHSHVIEVAIPGAVALQAAHPYFDIDCKRQRGELPNVVGDFLEAWAFRQSRQNFQSRQRRLDCGMIFSASLPPEWIMEIERVHVR